MKIIFILIGNESLGVEYLSSFLKQHGHQTDIYFDPNLFDIGVFRFKRISNFFDTKKEIITEVLSKNPDIIGFTSFSATYQRSLLLAKAFKKKAPNIPIIFGGIHSTSVPDLVIKEKCIDFVCVGEGEYPLVELLNNLNNPKKIVKIDNIWSKFNNKIVKNSVRPLITNLDVIPFPDKKLYYSTQPKFIQNEYFATSSRGCPFACTYCSNYVLKNIYKGISQPFRQRSTKNLIEELYNAKKNLGAKRIFFVDDVFVKDYEWIKDFVRLYNKKINLPFMVLTHPRFLTLPIAKLLSKSKCYMISFGIQTASEKTRFEILQRYETNKDIEIASKNCHTANLPFTIDHIFCLPGENINNQVESLKFYNHLRPNKITTNWLQYFPRTEIVKIAVKMKLIPKKMVSKIEQGLTNTSYFVGLSAKDTFNTDLAYTNIQFLLILLPYIPEKIMNKLIQKKVYLIGFKFPVIFNTLFMIIITLLKGKAYLYLDTFKLIFIFSIKNINLKLKYYKYGIN